MLTFVVCAFIAVLVAMWTAPLFENANRQEITDYSYGMEQINNKAQVLASLLSNKSPTNGTIQDIIDTKNAKDNFKILLVEEDGNVIYKTKQATETHIDLQSMIHSVIDGGMNIEDTINVQREFTSLYPFEREGKRLYVVVSGMPKGRVMYVSTANPFPFIIGIAVFIFLFYFLTKRKMQQIEAMAQGVKEISFGNLKYRIPRKSKDELGELAQTINLMAERLELKIEGERKAEQTKKELITNVSHDLRTPLTSIMGYLRLIRDKKYETEQQSNEYFEIVSNKTEQLKKLIEDLFEYTKLNNDEGVKVSKQILCINELVDQLVEEMSYQAEEYSLTFRKEFPRERLYIEADPNQIVRVFENLLANAIRYSFQPSVINVSMKQQEDYVQICVENHSNPFSEEELLQLFDRFYKTDESRSNVSEGSGLGLAIAKSIVHLNGGRIWAESDQTIIRFIVELPIICEEEALK
ncbi:ATP-binding protein [Ectobacillus polymachus]|uniref:sensor histidine kinase n=1 Tax=Ectobacillus polymachus TaxID=1508806 RepID=UPI003A843491